jgi:O-antigen ligase/tetratricopeptide (TPR) repeat protein
MEALVLALVCLAPWAFGAAEPGGEFGLYSGVAALLVLWAARLLLEGRLTWHRSPVALCLAGLVLLGAMQLVPWPAQALARVSPPTAQLYAELLPAEREIVDGGEAPGTAGRTVSLDAGATRLDVVRLLAMFLLFVTVRNNCASPAALRRLALALLVNGALLSLLAFAQLGSARGLIYWTFPSLNRPFGPFVCRNHYPYYVSMCFGLGAGLLASRWAGGAAGSRDRHRPQPGDLGRGLSEWWANPLVLLNEPGALWAGLALALTLASVALCLSRGGLFSFLAALAVCLGLRFVRYRRVGRPQVALLVGAAALAVAAWFGLGPLKARLAELAGDDPSEGRLGLWRDTLPLVRDFPLWGTGYGTFAVIEPAYRTRPDAPALIYDHVHNEYLEALATGGPLCLLLGLAALAFVYRSGWRALRRFGGQPAGELVLGALFGVTAVAAHSLVDFGLHLPAVAALLAVLCAHVCALGEPDEEATTFRLGGIAPLAGAVLAVGLGGVLFVEGWRLARVESLQNLAYRLDGRPGAEDQQRWLALLEAAAALAPERAEVQMVAAQAHLYLSEQGTAGAHHTAALRYYLRARDLCPLLAKVQMRLAAEAERLERADSPEAYRQRAKRLRPRDQELWYVAGLQELAGGRTDEAWASWRRSLELSRQFLPEVLARARRHLDTPQLIERVLPNNPDLLVRAAGLLYPGDQGRQRPLLEKALSLLDAAAPTAEDLFLRCQLRADLGDGRAALADCQAAVARQPRNADWRYALALLLRRQGDLRESRRELLLVLGQQPGHTQARRLLDKVTQELGRGEVGRASPGTERK